MVNSKTVKIEFPYVEVVDQIYQIYFTKKKCNMKTNRLNFLRQSLGDIDILILFFLLYLIFYLFVTFFTIFMQLYSVYIFDFLHYCSVLFFLLPFYTKMSCHYVPSCPHTTPHNTQSHLHLFFKTASRTQQLQ